MPTHAKLLKIAKHRLRVERAAVALHDALEFIGIDATVQPHPCCAPQTGYGSELLNEPGVSLRLDDVEAIAAKLGEASP